MSFVLVGHLYLYIENMLESTYNLQSSKADQIQVPIQLQLNNDTEFLSQLLKTNSQTHQADEESDSSSE